MLDIKITGIQDAVSKLNQYKKTIASNMRLLVERLTLAGYQIAWYAYSEAYYAGDRSFKMNDPYWDGDRLILSVEGDSIAFIEFGSGTFYEDYPSDIPGDATDLSALGIVGHGEYGNKKGANPPWTYVGVPGNMGEVIHTKSNGETIVKTMGNPPARGMYEASKTIADKEMAIQIAKEIFNR